MKITIAIKIIVSCLALSWTAAAFPHVVLDEPAALAGTSYKAVLRVGHGCEGSATIAITVLLPAGFQGAKPMPKPGWLLSTRREKLLQPYSSHGRQVTEDVTEVSWTAAAKESWLPDAWFDEFVLRGSLPAEAGPLWFKVRQTCEKGRIDWTQLPAAGTSIQGLKSPAVLLDVLPSGPAGHPH